MWSETGAVMAVEWKVMDQRANSISVRQRQEMKFSVVFSLHLEIFEQLLAAPFPGKQ